MALVGSGVSQGVIDHVQAVLDNLITQLNGILDNIISAFKAILTGNGSAPGLLDSVDALLSNFVGSLNNILSSLNLGGIVNLGAVVNQTQGVSQEVQSLLNAVIGNVQASIKSLLTALKVALVGSGVQVFHSTSRNKNLVRRHRPCSNCFERRRVEPRDDSGQYHRSRASHSCRKYERIWFAQ